MPENYLQTSEEIFRGDQDAFGFEVMFLKVAVRVQALMFVDIMVRIPRGLYDQMRSDPPMLSEYIKHLVMRELTRDLHITATSQDGTAVIFDGQ